MNPQLPPTPSDDARSAPPEQRRLAVIMFTDIVGYSALAHRDEALALELLEAHRSIVRPILAAHGGVEIKTIGDAFLVEFASALAGCACAIEIQRALHGGNATAAAGRRTQIRIGLHAGDVVHRENDVYGDGVNIAARIEPLAEPGGICVSEDVARQVFNKLECPLVKLGSGELKNISRPVVVYAVALPWQKPGGGVTRRMAFLFRRKAVRRATAMLLVGVLAGGAFLAFRPGRRVVAAIDHLAVLPLVNVSGDPRDAAFADGLTEELISTLATIRDLSVIARTSIARFKEARAGIAEIGAALDVGSVLEGSVRFAGDQVRINVNLVDVRTEKTRWSQEFTRPLKDVFAVQSAIAMSVSDALKVRLLSGEKDWFERKVTVGQGAFGEYLLGRAQLSRRRGADIIEAIGSFERAMAQDPGFALACAGLAEAYTLAGVAGYGSLPRDRAIAQARAFAEKAVALDDQLAEAHAALAYVRFRIDWDWAGAEAEFRRALALKPGVAHTHELFALLLAIRHRWDEARSEMERARSLDPLSPAVSNGLGRIYHFQRHYDEAIAQYRRTLALDPKYAEAHFSMGITHIATGRYDAAIEGITEALRLAGERDVMQAMLGMAHGLGGNQAEARRLYDQLRLKTEPNTTPSYLLGLLLIGLGDMPAAVERFERAYVERDGILIYLSTDPVAERVWHNPQIIALIRRMGLDIPSAR